MNETDTLVPQTKGRVVNMASKLSEQMKEVRKINNLSQEVASKKADVHVMTWIRAEGDKVVPKPDTVSKIEKFIRENRGEQVRVPMSSSVTNMQQSSTEEKIIRIMYAKNRFCSLKFPISIDEIDKVIEVLQDLKDQVR